MGTGQVQATAILQATAKQVQATATAKQAELILTLTLTTAKQAELIHANKISEMLLLWSLTMHFMHGTAFSVTLLTVLIVSE